MASKAFYAIVAGVGAGTGRSTALRFAKSYPVVLLARKPESYNDIVAEIRQSGGQAIGIATDTGSAESVAAAFGAIQKELPDRKLAAAIYNVGSGFVVKPFLETTPEDLELSLNGNPRGLYNFAQNAIPLLLDSVEDSPHPPTLLVTGATASLRGGVHVAHIIIDAVIDIPRTQSYVVNNGAPDGKTDPAAIADNYWYLHTQHRSAFTQELDVRPYVEKF